MLVISAAMAGCGAGAMPTPSGAGAVAQGDRPLDVPASAEDERAGDGTVAVYGALTTVGVGLGALGVYGLTRGEGPNERTGSRPELWLGVQGVVAGAALAIPFGALTVSSLAARDDRGSEASDAHVEAVDVRARSRGHSVEARTIVGPGSLAVAGTF